MARRAAKSLTVLGLAAVVVVGCFLSLSGARSSRAAVPAASPTETPLVAYAYVTAFSPNTGSSSPPPPNIYEFALSSQPGANPNGSVTQIGTLPGVLVTTTSAGFAYAGAPGGLEVLSIDSSGVLHDTGQQTGVAGAAAVAIWDQSEVIGGNHFAYLFKGTSGPQTIYEYKIDPTTGLFTQIGSLAANNDVSHGETFTSPIATNAFNGQGGGDLVANEGEAIGEFPIAKDGTLSAATIVPAPDFDFTNGCNNLIGNIALGFFQVFALQDGGANPPCGGQHGKLLVFDANPNTGRLSFSKSVQIPTADQSDQPDQIAPIAGFGSLIYVYDDGSSETITPTSGPKGCTSSTTYSGDLVVDEFLGLTSTESETIYQWQWPPEVACICPPPSITTGTQANGIVIGLDPTGTFLLVGKQGLDSITFPDGDACAPQVSLLQPAELQVFEIEVGSDEKPLLNPLTSFTLGSNAQVPTNIQFFNPVSAVPQLTEAPSLSPSSLDFTNLVPQELSAAKTVILTNKDKKNDAHISHIGVAQPFELPVDKCSDTTVKPGKKCTFTLACDSSKPGTFNGLIAIDLNGPAPSSAVTCKVAPLVLKSPPSATLPATPPGGMSRPRIIAVTNGTKGSATLGDCTLPPGYVFESDTCSGDTVGPRGNSKARCIIKVACTPPSGTAAGTVMAGSLTCPYTYGPDPADTGSVTTKLSCTVK